MKRITLDIELIDDVVLPRNIATSGTADTHDFVPGSVLLGVFAGRCYGRADQFGGAQSAYEVLGDLFQSGKVRFLDALPLDDRNLPCVPVPLSMHRPKVAGGAAKAAYDLSVEARPKGVQLTQMRSGYFTRAAAGNADQIPGSGYFHADIVQPSTSYLMRTAINEKTGRAREAQLFGYASLAAGQKFRGAIECDEDLVKQVETMLGLVFGDGETARIRVGRSKNAEYGRARLIRSSDAAWSGDGAGLSSCRLLLLSDLAAFDQYGQPTFAPTPQELGFSDAVAFDDVRCFVRFRSYAPYNAALGKREPERHVIERGSVLTLGGLSEADHKMIASGLGAFRQQGLGQVLVLDGTTPMVAALSADHSLTASDQGTAPALATVDDPARFGHEADNTFLLWLDQIAGSKRRVDLDLVDELVAVWREAYGSAHTIFGASHGTFIGPTRHQWSQIRTAARKNPDFDRLRQTLFDANDAICREQDQVWSLKTALKAQSQESGAMLRMRDILRGQFDRLAQDAQPNPADHLVALCAELERLIKEDRLLPDIKQASGEEV